MDTGLIFGFIYGGLFLFGLYALFIHKSQRPKPPGYIGKFQKPDAQIVHVARLADRTLMVISEEKPGVTPRDLGTVTGPELAAWKKLSSSPDGKDRVPRAK